MEQELAFKITFIVLMVVFLALIITVLVLALIPPDNTILDVLVLLPDQTTDRHEQTTATVEVKGRTKQLDSGFELGVESVITAALLVSPALPASASWEVVAQHITNQLWDMYSVYGISTAIGVGTDKFVYTRGSVVALT